MIDLEIINHLSFWNVQYFVTLKFVIEIYYT